MKKVIMVIAVVVLTCLLGFIKACAQSSAPEILSDTQMAAVRGGFCPFEECEKAPGTGVCQPVPPGDLCAGARVCTYDEETLFGITAYGCIVRGKESCTVSASYRQCIWVFKLSACSYGAAQTCGDLLEPHCDPDLKGRKCLCSLLEPGDACDWTDCAP